MKKTIIISLTLLLSLILAIKGDDIDYKPSIYYGSINLTRAIIIEANDEVKFSLYISRTESINQVKLDVTYKYYANSDCVRYIKASTNRYVNVKYTEKRYTVIHEVGIDRDSLTTIKSEGIRVYRDITTGSYIIYVSTFLMDVIESSIILSIL